jgi:UDP-N-acetylmuramyl tripeptide synthase
MRELFKLTLLGPNRRSDRTVIEHCLELADEELQALENAREKLPGRIRRGLQAVGALFEDALFPASGMPGAPAGALAWSYAATALALQRSTGHDVLWHMLPRCENPARAWAVFEHEVAEVGEYAGELALVLLGREVPGLAWQSGNVDPGRPFEELYAKFSAFARDRVLPGDTKAIAEAAARLRIPCTKLEREPYRGLDGDFRIRRNSMLMFGHCRHQRIVDGTLCINQARQLLPLTENPAALMGRLADMPFERAQPGATDGERHMLVVANHAVVACVPEAPVHPATQTLAAQISRRLGAGLVSVTVESRDMSRPLGQAGGAVVAVDPAPRLDEFLAVDSPQMRAAAEGFVRWLFPDGSPARIPVIAVTGTNGKTTTSRMIAHITRDAGRNTALRCSDGSYFNGEPLDLGEPGAVDPFYVPFESRETEVAVQETHFGRIVRLGFPYLESSVAVCTNVTTDHIGRLGVETVEQMAEVKRAVLERARDGVVLNADDPHCRAMLPHLHARKTCLVSTQSSVDELRSLITGSCCLCVPETIAGREWLVLHDGEARPVAPLDEIPATFDGAAVCNVYNAMQAVCACHVLGVDTPSMARALGTFRMAMDMALGRFNIYDGHPFTVVLDFAHNADGIHRIGEFLDAQDVEGRKLMLIAASGERGEIDIREKGRAAAEVFDHFVVRSYPDPRGREREEIVDYMSRFLREAGVPEEAITGVPDPDEGTRAILRMARPGDWLVMTWGNGEAERMWAAITDFESEI